MDRAEFGNRERVGSVNRILEGSPLMKPQMDFSAMTSSRAGELHMAQRDIGQYRERKTSAESVRTQAEYVLSNAKKTLKDLSLLIEISNLKANPQMLKQSRRREERALAVRNIESYQYADVLRELEFVKQELSKLKLDMAYVLEEKSRTEKEIQDSSSKMFSYLSSAQALTEEVEKANKEKVLVELAKIEALKEFKEIEAQRVEESTEFSAAMEKTKQKMKDIIEEIDQSKELETKLAVTLSHVDVLQSELKNREGEELGASPLLQPVMEELEAAKKELALVREEGFQFMASVDIIRNELKHVTKETVRLKKTEEKADLTAQNLNSKRLRVNIKLEATSSAEKKSKSISSNLSLSLEQLKTEGETVEKEKELIRTETATIKAEILKAESEIDITEERLQVAVQELEVVKSSEVLALENLRTLVENTMRARAEASASQHSSKITISKFEYEYLTGRAGGAEEIADKKVEAAHAWIEALKASEKEILIETELAQRKIREMKLGEETDKSLSAKRIVEGGLENCRQKREKNVENAEAENLQLALLPKSMKGNGNMTPSRGAKFQKSASPAARKAASPAARHINSFVIKKKTKVMPNLAKWFSGIRIDRDR